MNVWLWTGAVLVGMLLPCGLVAMRGSPVDRVLGLQLGGVVGSLAFIALGEGFGRSVYVDLGLVLAVLSFTGVLLFTRFLERWV